MQRVSAAGAALLPLLPFLLVLLFPPGQAYCLESSVPAGPETLYPRIFSVREGSTGEQAGVAAGDYLVLVSGILPRSASHADSLIAYGPADISVLRGDSVLEMELGMGPHGIRLGGPEAVVAPQSVFLEGLDSSLFASGEDARAAAWTAIADFVGAPVGYERMMIVSGAAFWSMWFEPGASISSACSDASWFDRKMAGAAGLATASGVLDRTTAVARNSISSGYPAIATGFGDHGTVLVAGYQLFGDTLYGYNRFGQVVSAASCSTVVGVAGVGPPPDPEALLDGALPFARTLVYMTSWRPTIFDELGRPETDVYAVGTESFTSWIDWLGSDAFPEGSLELSRAVRACEAVAASLAERRRIAAAFLDSLALSSSDYSDLAAAAADFSEVSDLLGSLVSPEILALLGSPSGRDEWISVLQDVRRLEERAVESVMSAP